MFSEKQIVSKKNSSTCTINVIPKHFDLSGETWAKSFIHPDE